MISLDEIYSQLVGTFVEFLKNSFRNLGGPLPRSALSRVQVPATKARLLQANGSRTADMAGCFPVVVVVR